MKIINKKYKIALVSEMYLPRIGGLELHVRDLARELNACGHEAQVICNTPGPLCYQDGVRIHRLGLPRLPLVETVADLRTGRTLRDLFLRERYDVIHVQSGFLPLSHIACYQAKSINLPCVFTEVSWQGAEWLTFFSMLHRATGWGNWPTCISGVSQCVADQLAEITNRSDVFVLHNGVRVRDWQTKPGPRLLPQVVSVMRFARRKQPVDVVRALREVHSLLPSTLRPRFVLIGDGPERASVQREIAKLKVAPYIDLPGFLDRSTIHHIFESSSVFILPTEREAMSIVCVEALAAGLPVVARSHNGVADVVAHGREGFLAANFNDFAEYIAQLIRDPDLRERLAKGATARVERFAWEHVVLRNLHVYALAIARTNRLPEPALNRFGHLQENQTMPVVGAIESNEHLIPRT